MIDQAEEIRRRLEALQNKTGTPLPPPTPSTNSEPTAFGTPPPVPHTSPPLHPETEARVRKLKADAAIADPSNAQPVVVVDVRIRFLSMMVLLIKMSIAAIPAMIITILFWMLFFSALGGWGQILRFIFGKQ